MKKFMTFILVSMLQVSAPAWAFQLQTRLTSGPIEQQVSISCAADEASQCQSLCGDAKNCSRQEPICRNCLGTSSNFMRLLFTKLNQVYSPTQVSVSAQEVLAYLAGANYILVEPKSIYNYYSALQSLDFEKAMKDLCPTQLGRPVLAVQLDQVNQPVDVSFVICRDEKLNVSAYRVAPRHIGTPSNQLLRDSLDLTSKQ